MKRAILRFAFCLAAFALAPICGLAAAVVAQNRHLDHVFIIVLENRSFDDALFGPTPFLRRMAQTQGLATYYFGVSHPSLPNYLAMIGGDDFGIHDDALSCFATDLPKNAECHGLDQQTLADQLEERGLTWAYYGEDLPIAGSLLGHAPGGEAGPLYAQKHNPFAYFRQIAENAERRAKMKPLEAFQSDLSGKAPTLSFIVPNQCNDGHGLPVCPNASELAKRYDRFVEQTVNRIRASRAWTARSAIVITFDEGGPPNIAGAPLNADCCGQSGGGHHIATVVITPCDVARRNALPLNHYSLLATIEEAFDLPRLGKAVGAETMHDLLRLDCH